MLTLPLNLGAEDVKRSLTAFILDHLFASKMFASDSAHKGTTIAVFSKVRVICLCHKSVGNSKALLEFILKKFLLLVFFLDQAKLTRLIDFDPCLFQTSSAMKVRMNDALLVANP